MGADQNIDWAKSAASALEWWADAGVDVLVEDAPRDWRAAPAAPIVAEPAKAPAPAEPALPDTLEAFAAWRAGKDAPDARWGGVAVPGGIVAGAPLLVLVDCPEREDRETLWSGPAGRLLDNMLRAIGRSRADTSIAAACWRLPSRSLRELPTEVTEATRHHLALAAPAHVLVLGDAATRALLGTNVAEARGRLHPVNHRNGNTFHVIASFHPGFLLRQPECKADAWRDLLLLNEGLS